MERDVTHQQPSRTEAHDGILIEWDVPIAMNDATILRCDVFRPDADGKYPVIMGATPYGKLLSFQSEVWGGQWKMLCAREPEILKRSSNRFQNYEFPDPERFVTDGYALVRVDVRGTGRSPGFMDLLSIRETLDYYECIEWAAAQPWSSGKVGRRCVLSCHKSMAGGGFATTAPLRYVPMGGLFGFLSRVYPPRRHLQHLWRPLVQQIHLAGAKRPGRARLAQQHEWRMGLRTRRPCRMPSSHQIGLTGGRAAVRPFRHRRVLGLGAPKFSHIETPLLSAANWGGHGLHLRGNIAGFEQAGSPQKWLNFHCLEHWTEYYTRGDRPTKALSLRIS